MLKFLRKYNKWILAVGGSLLMVAFVAPQAITQIGGGPGGATIASYDGGAITVAQRQEASRELDIIRRVGLGALGIVRSADESEDQAVHWLLLSDAAQRAGLVGGPGDGVAFLNYAARQIAQAQASQYAEPGTQEHQQILDLLVQLATDQLMSTRESLIQSGVLPEGELDMLLARARGVFRLYENYFDAMKLSDLEAIDAAQEALDQVGVNYTILRATRVVPEAPPPRPEQFEEFFEEYKDVERGEPPHAFGYLYRPAVKIEMVQIALEEIRSKIAIDPIEANAYWRSRQGEYGEDWADARAQVIADLRERRLDEILDELHRVIAAELRRARSGLTEDSNGFLELPEDWALSRPSLTAISLKVQDVLRERYGVEIEQPDVLDLAGQWFTRDSFTRLTGFETASLQIGPERVSTEDAAFSVRELDPAAPYGMQAGLVYGPAVADEIDYLYYFRVSDIRRRQPPETLEEVRSEVAQDIQKWNAYQMLLEQEDQLRTMVVEGGLSAIVERWATEIEEEVVVSRTGVNPPQTMDFDQDFVREAIMRRARRLDPRELAIDQPVEDRIVIVPLPYALAVAIVEIIDQRPLSRELFRLREPRAVALARSRLTVETPEDWPYSFVSLSKAKNLQWRAGEAPGDDEPAPPAQAATP